MTKDLIRRCGRGELHFITFSCYRRSPPLGSARARNTFVQILDEVRDRCGFALVGYVIMPEHVHLLIGEPRPRNTFHRDAGFEAACFAAAAAEEKTSSGTIGTGLRRVEKSCRCVSGSGGFLISTCGV